MSRYPAAGLSLRMAACLAAVAAVYLVFTAWVGLFAVGWLSFAAGTMPSAGGLLAAVAAVALLPVPLFPSLAQGIALRRLGAEPPADGERERLVPVVERLAALADVPPPRVLVVPSAQGNAFSTASLGGSTVAVTRGLLERLDGDELEAVVAHELAHVAHRDAFVMTLAVLPGLVLRGVAGRVARRVRRAPAVALVAVFVLVPAVLLVVTGWLAYAFTTLLSTALSRTRELAADHAAALLTGRPGALMSALQALGDGPIPAHDARSPAALDALALVPAEREPAWTLDPLRLFPSHPPLVVRLERLARLARGLGDDAVPPARPPASHGANRSASAALLLVVALYALSAWAVLRGDADVVFSGSWALVTLVCGGGGLLLGLRGVAVASRGASGMTAAAAALGLLVAPVVAGSLGVALGLGVAA